MSELTAYEWMFVAEYIECWNAAEAMRRVPMYNGNFPSQEGYRLLAKPRVAAEIKKAREQITGKIMLKAEMVVQDIVNVLQADPRELFEIVTVACRYCHGENHLYQRTQAEYMRDMNAQANKFNHAGGTGFNPYKGPHADCPECFGMGETLERIKDVRELSPGAAALYFGGKRGKHGLEINMRSKDAAREAAAKYLGLNKETLRVVDGKLEDMDDDQLAAIARGEPK